MKIIQKSFKNHPQIQKLSKKNLKKTSKNHSQITPKSPPKKDYNPPKLKVKIGININDDNNNNKIIIISCTAVQLFQEFIILLKG